MCSILWYSYSYQHYYSVVGFESKHVELVLDEVFGFSHCAMRARFDIVIRWDSKCLIFVQQLRYPWIMLVRNVHIDVIGRLHETWVILSSIHA